MFFVVYLKLKTLSDYYLLCTIDTLFICTFSSTLSLGEAIFYSWSHKQLIQPGNTWLLGCLYWYYACYVGCVLEGVCMTVYSRGLTYLALFKFES